MDEPDDIKKIEPIWMEWMTYAVLRTWMDELWVKLIT
jgi:hypothetical protein